MELILGENKKLLIAKKKWNGTDRFEICLFRKKNDKWIPTVNFINVPYSIKNKLSEIINQV